MKPLRREPVINPGASSTCTPVSDALLWPFQPYFGAACFLAGCFERERWLDLQGLLAYWSRAPFFLLAPSLGTWSPALAAARPQPDR